MLYDGALELEGTEGTVPLSSPMVAGKTLTITLDGETVTAEVADYEGATTATTKINFESAERTISIVMPPGYEMAVVEIENTEPHIEGGEFPLKLVQS